MYLQDYKRYVQQGTDNEHMKNRKFVEARDFVFALHNRPLEVSPSFLKASLEDLEEVGEIPEDFLLYMRKRINPCYMDGLSEELIFEHRGFEEQLTTKS